MSKFILAVKSVCEIFVPLRFWKAGRAWCGGARETYWPTCQNEVTFSKTKELFKSPCFLDLNDRNNVDKQYFFFCKYCIGLNWQSLVCYSLFLLLFSNPWKYLTVEREGKYCYRHLIAVCKFNSGICQENIVGLVLFSKQKLLFSGWVAQEAPEFQMNLRLTSMTTSKRQKL